MPTYVFHLHDGPDVPPMREEVQAMTDDEARNLADLRISLSHTFTHVRVEREGAEVFRIQRDSVDALT